jgi:hypothetical protein
VQLVAGPPLLELALLGLALDVELDEELDAPPDPLLVVADAVAVDVLPVPAAALAVEGPPRSLSLTAQPAIAQIAAAKPRLIRFMVEPSEASNPSMEGTRGFDLARGHDRRRMLDASLRTAGSALELTSSWSGGFLPDTNCS